jgi:hypothetical protein
MIDSDVRVQCRLGKFHKALALGTMQTSFSVMPAIVAPTNIAGTGCASCPSDLI